jgi:hypothetical protein
MPGTGSTGHLIIPRQEKHIFFEVYGLTQTTEGREGLCDDAESFISPITASRMRNGNRARVRVSPRGMIDYPRHLAHFEMTTWSFVSSGTSSVYCVLFGRPLISKGRR